MSALYVQTGGARALPIDLLLSAIPSLPRHVLDRLVERAIDHLDQLDGDPDLEGDGDEQDGNHAEDDFASFRADGPGCPVSDPAWLMDEEGV